jgi:molybdenum cofactor guanylyltransferase
MTEKVSAIVLAGGKSSRMGQDKMWMTLEGKPLIERVVLRLLPLADEVLMSARYPEQFEAFLHSLPIPALVVTDQYPGAGPLAGMHAGLNAARNDLALVIAADMPFVNVALIQHMIELAHDYDGVAPRIYNPTKRAGELEPLHALYRRSCLTAIERHLAANDRQVFCFFQEVHIRYVEAEEMSAFDPDLLSFFNVNTPEDWQRAQRLAAEEARQ